MPWSTNEFPPTHAPSPNGSGSKMNLLSDCQFPPLEYSHGSAKIRSPYVGLMKDFI